MQPRTGGGGYRFFCFLAHIRALSANSCRSPSPPGTCSAEFCLPNSAVLPSQNGGSPRTRTAEFPALLPLKEFVTLPCKLSGSPLKKRLRRRSGLTQRPQGAKACPEPSAGTRLQPLYLLCHLGDSAPLREILLALQRSPHTFRRRQPPRRARRRGVARPEAGSGLPSRSFSLRSNRSVRSMSWLKVCSCQMAVREYLSWGAHSELRRRSGNNTAKLLSVV